MNRKGQVIDNIGALVVPIVVVAVILVVGFLIFAEVETQSIDIAPSVSVVNETITYTNATATALANSGKAMQLSCSAVFNTTINGGGLIPDDIYTCDRTGITLTNDLRANESNITVVYSYKLQSFAFNGTLEVKDAASQLPPWLPVIIIVVIGAILIGLVAVFRQRLG